MEMVAIRQRRASLATEPGDPTRGASPDIPAGANRLAEILGASPRRNRFGEHLGLRRWFSKAVGDGLVVNAPEQELDPAALSLLGSWAATEDIQREAAPPVQGAASSVQGAAST